MPIPKPRAGESARAFVSRCVSDEVMLREYPDDEQRAAVCYRQLEEKTMAKKTKDAASKGRVMAGGYVRDMEEGEKYLDAVRAVRLARKLDGYRGADANRKWADLMSKLLMAGFAKTSQKHLPGAGASGGSIMTVMTDADGDTVTIVYKQAGDTDVGTIKTNVRGYGMSRGYRMAVDNEYLNDPTRSLTGAVKTILERAERLNNKKDTGVQFEGLRKEAILVAGMKGTPVQSGSDGESYTLTVRGLKIEVRRDASQKISVKVSKGLSRGRAMASESAELKKLRMLIAEREMMLEQAQDADDKPFIRKLEADLKILRQKFKAAGGDPMTLSRRGRGMGGKPATRAGYLADGRLLCARKFGGKPTDWSMATWSDNLVATGDGKAEFLGNDQLRVTVTFKGGRPVDVMKMSRGTAHLEISELRELVGLCRQYAASLRETPPPRHSVVAHACASSYRAGKRLDKDAIRVGRYVHPREGWELDVDEARIDRWVKNMSRMLAKGVTIPLVKGHDVSCDTTLGYVQAVRREGQELRLVTEVPDDERAAQCERVNNVSVYVERDYMDGTGERYDETITHVALTPEPVVPGQGGFISIAASSGRASEEVPVYVLAARGGAAVKKELLQRFREVTKAAADAAEDEVMQSVATHLEERVSEMERQREEIAELRAQLERQSTRDDEAELDDDEAEERASDVATDIDGMVESGQLTPVAAALLRDELCGVAGARNSYMLSRTEYTTENGIRPVRARALLRIIKEIKPVALGGKTGPQGRGLSRDGGPAPEGDKLTERLLKIAGNGKGVSQLVL